MGIMVNMKNRRKLEKQLRSKLLHILYHGTTKKTAAIIMKEGFKPWTYFAKNLSEAINYGRGKKYTYVFAVVMEHKLAPEFFEGWLKWQIMNHDHIPVTKILNLRKFSRKVIFLNKELWNEVGRRNIEYYMKFERYGK